MPLQKILAIGALICVLLSFVASAVPLVTIAVLLLALAWLVT